MSAERCVELVTDGHAAISLTEAIGGIEQRSNSDCEFAWDFFDERFPGETMDIVTKLAAMGWDTRRIHGQFMKFFPHGLDWEPRMHEMVCLSIEHAVRKAKL